MSVNSSLSPLFYYCFDSRPAVIIFTTFIVTKILLCCPLSILVFCLGHQQWWRRRYTMTTNPSDIFAYHVAAVELNSLIAYIFYFCGTYTDFPVMAKVGFYVSKIALAGDMLFHCLTCVERYLAVVHPIIYQGLRQSSGVRIRNVGIGCVWLLCFVWVGIVALYSPNVPIIPLFCFLLLSLLVVSFCSLSVLCALIRPGPGEVGHNKKRVDQSKQRAFHTVMVILVVLCLWFVGILMCYALSRSLLLSYNDGCMVMMCGLWCCLPSSLVLPLLFLHRAEKLQFCHYGN